MATTYEASNVSDAQSVPKARTPVARQIRPVVVWASIGAVFVAIGIYSWAGWILGGRATPTPTGVTPVPTSDYVFGLVVQVLTVTAVIATIVYVVRGCLRERRWTFDASLLCGMVLMTWQDPGINYLVSQFSYSSVLFNFGSWTSDIPGWVSPRANLLPETLMTLLAYFFCAGIVIGTCGLLRKFVVPRFPNMSNAKIIAVICVLMIVLDFIMETSLAHGHVISYYSVIKSWTLWPGTDHQFPIYESLVWGVTGWAPFVALRWFRDDKGRSFVERGLDQMRISNKFKNVLTVLAIAAATNFGYFAYNLAFAFIGTQVDLDSSHVYPSYLINSQCGEGTPYPCPDITKGRPIPVGGAPADANTIPGPRWWDLPK
jgi:hypothetical protein